MKPLFIPLRTVWFNLFSIGEKATEYRAYGPRWNERVCFKGRPATISHGYSGARLKATIKDFKILTGKSIPSFVSEIYPDAERIAAISLDLHKFSR